VILAPMLSVVDIDADVASGGKVRTSESSTT
jgi:hypothetical protein